MSDVIAETVTETPATLLFVDDEANILSSLRRLFRPQGYRILIAEGGAQGLEIMAQEHVDLVVSDMRMPEMNGAQFLEKVRGGWPDTVRILLTGYAEIEATIDAINKGQIYRYISKPWDDNDIVLIIRHALQQKRLEREKLRLEELTNRQNKELTDLNANLEARVLARTSELKQTMQSLEAANDKQKKSFIMSVRVFANLIEMRNPKNKGHSRRVGDMARVLAEKMGMSALEAQDTFIAALLLDVGTLGLSDHLLGKPFQTLNTEEREKVSQSPVRGEMALMALEPLQGTAKLIRSHCEHFNGGGYPDRIFGKAIPLGARILAVVNDYDLLLMGSEYAKPLTSEEALSAIQASNGKRYDPEVLDAFVRQFALESVVLEPVNEVALHSRQLESGMILSQDLAGQNGDLLLSKGHELSEQIIGRLRGYEQMGKFQFTIYTYVQVVE